MLEKLNFTVDSALLEELGEKLVETVHVALVELVKNSYDADASSVEILFTKGVDNENEIHIIDNGRGMSFQSVQNYWMRIATTNKEKNPRSKIYGRPLTGAKGIGRFSCRRLGNKLILDTVGTENGKSVGVPKKVSQTIVEFPWQDFRPGTDVTEIECVGQINDLNNKPTGTTLIISGIVDEWNTVGWNWLKRQLAVLAANTGAKRKGYKDDPGFEVRITAPDFEGGIRDIRTDYINAGWGTLTAHINKRHQAVCELNALGIGKMTITSTTKFLALKDVRLEIGIMVGDRSQMRDTSAVSLSNMQQILPDWGGVQVRYRNFRVFPYGDDDWLEIDRDRGLRKSQSRVNELVAFAGTLRGVDPSRSLLNMLSMQSYLGSVYIGEGAEGFEMKLNREGFVSSPSVDQLKSFVRFAIDWSTVLRDYYLRKHALEKSAIAVKDFEEVIQEKLEPTKYIEAALHYLEKEAESIIQILPESEREGVKTTFQRATDVIRTRNESTRAELLHLRLVASTSTLLLIFSHEVKSLLGLLEQSKNSLQVVAARLQSKDRNSVLEITSSFSELKLRLEDLLEMTALVGAENRKSKPGRVALRPKIEKVEKVFSLITKKYDIDIDYSNVPNGIALNNILEAEVYSVLLNVISNSIKSVIAAGKSRVISISAERKDGLNTLLVKDTGVGLNSESFEEVFIPFISDPKGELYTSLDKHLNQEDKLIVGSGSGLGLGIVQEIIQAHNGTIKFLPPSGKWRAILQIKIS